MVDIMEEIADHIIVFSAACGDYIRLACAGVINVFMVALKDVALDMGVGLKVEGVIAATQEDVVKNLRDRVRTRWPVNPRPCGRGGVKINRIIMSLCGSENIIFDDEVTVFRDTATPDMLAAVVGGRRLIRAEDISEHAVGHNQRRINRADTAQVGVV
jgi:hypothetical protein